MAGIGFSIQKLLDRDTYLGAIEGYFLGAFVAAGPMVILIFAIGLLSVLSQYQVGSEDVALFRVTLVYVYGLSLVSVGLVQMNITRYVSDLLYGGQPEKVLPTLITSVLLVAAMNAVIGLLVFRSAGLGVWYTYRTVALLVLVSCNWLLMVFIAATKQYLRIALAFVCGSIVAIYLGDKLGDACGIIGYLEGYTVGQALIFCTLVAVVAKSFPCQRLFDAGIFRYFRQFPELLFIGFSFNLAMWIDKVIIWQSDFGEVTAGFFRTFDLYDGSTFIAYMTVIPSLTYFLVRVETSFYIKYRKLYAVITSQGSLAEIERARDDMLAELGASVGNLVKLQATVTLIGLLLCSPIMRAVKFSPMQWGMFRVALLGSMLLVLLQLMVTVMLYFEFRRQAAIVTGVYCLTNALFTMVTVRLGYEFLGYGFTIAALVSLLLGYVLLDASLRRLIYHTFASQPIQAPSTQT